MTLEPEQSATTPYGGIEQFSATSALLPASIGCLSAFFNLGLSDALPLCLSKS